MLAIPFTTRSPDRCAITLLAGLPAVAADVRARRQLCRRWPRRSSSTTSAGDIVIELDAAKAPKTVDNFVQYVKAGHYDGTIFHRVIPNFMIQGGGMTADMKREADPRADPAREPQRPEQRARHASRWRAPRIPNSATAQFFINVKDNDFLNAAQARDGNGYAVFGKVDLGHGRGRQDPRRRPHTAPATFPSEPVVIKKATLEK